MDAQTRDHECSPSFGTCRGRFNRTLWIAQFSKTCGGFAAGGRCCMSSSSSSAFTLPDDPLEDLFPGESAISIDPTRAPLYIPQRKAQGFARKPRARAPLPTTPSSSVMSDSPKIKITAWRPFQKNTLLGFVTVEF